MASTGLHGPYPLTSQSIAGVVTHTSAGAYALGDTNTEGVFVVRYVGRSDTDVNARLNSHVGNYQEFKFDYFGSPKAAFDKECGLFHDFGESRSLANQNHPARPTNSGWKCPRCLLFG